MKRLLQACLSLAIGLSLAAAAAAAEPFELRDGDRVALVGSTLIEREQRYGYWEAALAARWPDRHIVFRNLAWSGDTVWGDARASFDTAKEGYQRLLAIVDFAKPTVIIVAYGANESFAGAAGLDHFKAGFDRLLDDLEKTKARIVILTPNPMAALGAPFPDPAAHNRDLRLYADAMKAAAEKRGHRFADLLAAMEKTKSSDANATENAVDLTARGYAASVPALEKALGLKPSGIETGAEPFERLRAAIVEKNRLFFNRWRPQNETYLFGFRKHEQGQNAKEIPMFDPLVEEAEKGIAELRGLKSGGQTLKPAAEGKK